MTTKTKATTFARLKQEYHTEPELVAVPATAGQPRHWLTGTWGSDLTIHCWCQKSHRLNTLGWKLMVEGMNRFFDEHTDCEPKKCN